MRPNQWITPGRDRLTRDREVVDRLAGLVTPELCHVIDLLDGQPTDGGGADGATPRRCVAPGFGQCRAQAGVDRRRGGGLAELHGSVDRPDRPWRDRARDGDLDEPGRLEAATHRRRSSVARSDRASVSVLGGGTLGGEHGAVGTGLEGGVVRGRPGGGATRATCDTLVAEDGGDHRDGDDRADRRTGRRRASSPHPVGRPRRTPPMERVRSWCVR